MAINMTAPKLAQRMIEKFGKAVTLRRTTRTTYDPLAGTGGADNVPVDYAVKVTPPEGFMFSVINGTLIESGDQVAMLAALNAPIVPEMETDTVIMNSVEWKLRQVGTLWAGDDPAAYILHMGK